MLAHATTKTELEAKLRSLTTQLEHIATYNSETGDWEATPVGTETAESDSIDEADVVEEWNERHATVAVLEVDYRNTKRALEKIENGTYGTCEISGKPIEPERLSANPLARTCIAHMNEEGSLPL
jgi:RNA polymerase-binding transcription factor DksA